MTKLQYEEQNKFGIQCVKNGINTCSDNYKHQLVNRNLGIIIIEDLNYVIYIRMKSIRI